MLISAELSRRLQKMIGFRNVAVHPYPDLDLAIVEAVIRNGLDELLAFAEIVGPLSADRPPPSPQA
jgi:uncharacterized protein YutE (UPF0331/DUF86 family)